MRQDLLPTVRRNPSVPLLPSWAIVWALSRPSKIRHAPKALTWLRRRLSR